MDQVLKPKGAADPTVCFCYRLTVSQLKESYQRCGSLRAVQDETRAGTACGGCRIILESLFKEKPDEINNLEKIAADPNATLCFRPGNRVMKGFIVADGQLESTVYSSNAVPPQFGDCNSTMEVAYALLDHRGQVVLHNQEVLATNQTFIFNTKDHQLPRPFYGLFLYAIGRGNYGSSRFNICWSNGKSTTSTHELAGTGRVDVVIPVVVTNEFVKGPNTYYLALSNPQERALTFTVSVFEVDSQEEFNWSCKLPPNGVTWLNANDELFSEALAQRPNGKFVLRILSSLTEVNTAISVNFFLHNKATDIWTCNHI